MKQPITSSNSPEKLTIFPVLQVKNCKLKETKKPTSGKQANKEHCWDFNPAVFWSLQLFLIDCLKSF